MIHIRKPRPKRRSGNQFYRNKDLNIVDNFCGGDFTWYDLECKDITLKKFKEYNPFYVEKGGICPICLKLAKEEIKK